MYILYIVYIHFWRSITRLTPLLKKLNRARNDLSGKVIPLFKTYQDWEKKIIFEPFDQENLAGQPTILVRLNWPFFTPICQKAWQANYFIRAHRLKIHIKCSEFGFVARDESNGISWFAKFSNKKQNKKKYFFVFFVLVRATILLGNFDMVDHTFSIALAWVSLYLCIQLFIVGLSLAIPDH